MNSASQMEHTIARTFHKVFRVVERCLLLGLMVAVSIEAQQSSPPAPAWTGVVRTAAGEPVTGAKVTVLSAAAKEKMTAVTGSDGRFAIADTCVCLWLQSTRRTGRRGESGLGGTRLPPANLFEDFLIFLAVKAT
jgi:hypothetical protein